jgi:hypothetical protein
VLALDGISGRRWNSRDTRSLPNEQRLRGASCLSDRITCMFCKLEDAGERPWAASHLPGPALS